MNLVMTVIMIAITLALIVQLILTPVVIKKWSLITLLGLSIFLRLMGYSDTPTDAERFLWFIYDTGVMLWLFFAVERKKRSNDS
ncbi:hypothetical protein [Vibrio paucivorans]